MIFDRQPAKPKGQLVRHSPEGLQNPAVDDHQFRKLIIFIDSEERTGANLNAEQIAGFVGKLAHLAEARIKQGYGQYHLLLEITLHLVEAPKLCIFYQGEPPQEVMHQIQADFETLPPLYTRRDTIKFQVYFHVNKLACA